MRRTGFWIVGLAAAILAMHSPSPAQAACPEHPATALGSRLARLGQPAPLLLLSGAVVTPFVFAPSGIDQNVRVFAQRDLGGRYDAERISVTAPYSLAAGLVVGYGAALIAHDCGAAAVAARSLQAMGIAFVVMASAKLIVGRTYPAGDPYASDRLVDDGRSRRFAPFAAVGAWPSGHAAATFAFAAAVRTALPRDVGAFRYVGYALAGIVSAAMLYGDHHWASDVVSGALLGEAVGRAVGEPLDAPRGAVSHVHATPTGAVFSAEL
jgi:membrane-associated phospholipid phosphatase